MNNVRNWGQPIRKKTLNDRKKGTKKTDCSEFYENNSFANPTRDMSARNREEAIFEFRRGNGNEGNENLERVDYGAE